MAITCDPRSCFLIALILSVVLGLAVPNISSSLVLRGQACTNAPNTIAGTLFDRRMTASSIGSRSTTDTVRWCAHNSPVYLLLTQSGALHISEVAAILASAWVRVHTRLATTGDGLLAGEFSDQLNNVVIRVWNVNNHQTTWGVLYVAILTLKDFLLVKKGMGAVVFKIFDGNNQVGQGQIYYATSG